MLKGILRGLLMNTSHPFVALGIYLIFALGSITSHQPDLENLNRGLTENHRHLKNDADLQTTISQTSFFQ